MKKIRFLSAVMAACLSLSMFAGAVDTSANETAETRTGVAHVAQADGTTVEVPFEYTVPADATSEEASAIGLEAANLAVSGGVQTRASSDTLFTKVARDVDIPPVSSSLSSTNMSKRLTSDLSKIAIVLEDVETCTTVNVSLRNSSHKSETVYKVNPARTDMTVVFFDRCVADDGHSILFLDNGDKITAYVSGNVKGHASVFRMIGYL